MDYKYTYNSLIDKRRIDMLVESPESYNVGIFIALLV